MDRLATVTYAREWNLHVKMDFSAEISCLQKPAELGEQTELSGLIVGGM